MEQKAVNETAQGTVDTLDYVLQWILGAWDALPIGLKAFALTVFAASLMMEWTKRAILAGQPKAQRIKNLWLASMPIGLSLAAVGWALAGNHIEAPYWIVIGLTAGTTAMGVHYMTIKVALPVLKVIYSRFMLAVRGNG